MLDTAIAGVGHLHHPGSSSPKKRVLCGICFVRPVEANGRCGSCRRYLNRTGFDRTPELIERQSQRGG